MPTKPTHDGDTYASAQGSVGAIPEVGTEAPDFTLPNEQGEPVHLAALRGKQAVLYFYPRDATPGCTVEACAFRDAWHDFDAHGIVVLGISRDSVKSHQKFASKNALPFTLLSDEQGVVAQLYGVWVQKSNYGRHYMSTARTTFYVRPDGRIGHVWEQVRPEGHAKKVLDYVVRA